MRLLLSLVEFGSVSVLYFIQQSILFDFDFYRNGTIQCENCLCILFRSSVISKSNGLDLANFTKSACFKTRSSSLSYLAKRSFSFSQSCSKTRNQLRGSTFHSRDIYCLFNIVPGNISQFTVISFHFSLLPKPLFVLRCSVSSLFLLVFCKPLLQFFLLLSFNKPIHYYPNSNNQYHYQRYFHQSPIRPLLERCL
jgi:hypothetical protein